MADTSSRPSRSSSGSRFNSLRGRLGSRQLEWRIGPLTNTVVRFDLEGLGDPFHRILGTDLSAEYSPGP